MVALHETVAAPEPIIVPGVIEPQTRPEGTLSVRVTVPENLLIAVTVMVEVPDWPALVGAGELAEMEESEAGAWKNSVIAVAPASLDVIVARPQFVSIVLVK